MLVHQVPGGERNIEITYLKAFQNCMATILQHGMVAAAYDGMDKTQLSAGITGLSILSTVQYTALLDYTELHYLYTTILLYTPSVLSL